MVQEQVALEHPVVQLPLPVGLPAEGALELRVGGQQTPAPVQPGVQGPEGPAEGAVELLRLPALPSAAPRRAGLVTTRPRGSAPVEGAAASATSNAHQVLHPRQGGVLPGQCAGAGVQVPAPDLICSVEFAVHGLLCGVQPQTAVQPGPFLGREGAVQSGCPVFGDEGGFNGDSAEPQKGSQKGSFPRYRDSSTMAAAKVSRRGAATPWAR